MLIKEPELINNNSKTAKNDLKGSRSGACQAWEGLHVEKGRAQRRSMPLAFCSPLEYSHVVLIKDPELINNNSMSAKNDR